MKSNLDFFDAVTMEKSPCNDHFSIEISSSKLEWEGIILEKGTASHFITDKVVTPYFFFSMELSNQFNWNVCRENDSLPIYTEIGDIWVNPPKTPISHHNPNSAEFLLLAIDEKTMYSHIDGFIPKNKLEFLTNYSISDKILKHLMETFLIEVENKGLSGQGFLNNLLKLFCNYFIKNYSNIESLLRDKTQISVISENQLSKLDEYIENNISTNILVDDLASQIFMNRFHFLKEFKKLTGITPYQYIMQIRVNKSKGRLTESEESITEISLDLGFSDSSHFSRTFKKFTGLTPLQYRRSNK